MLAENEQDLLTEVSLRLHDIEAVRFGRFTLHNGRTTSINIDLRLLSSYPQVLRLAARAYQQVLQSLDFDLIAATPLAGLPIGTAISLAMDVPLIYPRQSTRNYRTGNQIEGKWEVGKTAVVIDDLSTSGDSLSEGIAFLKAAGLHVNDAVVLLDQELGGRELLKGQVCNLHCVLTISRMLEILEENGRLSAKKRSQVLKRM
jgi:uridine monophosphate synthetase